MMGGILSNENSSKKPPQPTEQKTIKTISSNQTLTPILDKRSAYNQMTNPIVQKSYQEKLKSYPQYLPNTNNINKNQEKYSQQSQRQREPQKNILDKSFSIPQRPPIVVQDPQKIYINRINQQFIPNHHQFKKYFYQQYQTKYPLNINILKQYNEKPINQPFYTTNQAQNILAQKLSNMPCHKQKWKFRPAGQNKVIFWKQDIIKIYVEVKCNNQLCRLNNLKNEKLNTRINSYGKIELNYQIKKFPKYQNGFQQQQKQKFEECIQWELKFYELGCKACQKWPDVKIYKEQLQPIFQVFCYKLNMELSSIQQQKQRRIEQQNIQNAQKIQQKDNYFENDDGQENEGDVMDDKQKYSENDEDEQQFNQDEEEDDQQEDQEDSEDQENGQEVDQEVDQQYKDEDQWNYQKSKKSKIIQQITSKYPYTRSQISALFQNKDVYNQPVYNIEQVQNYILEELQEMSQYGYDFRIQPYWNFDKSKSRSNRFNWTKKMKRKLYLRMKCKNCKDQQGRQKAWTSILGLGQINFMVDDLVDFLEDNPNFQSTVKTPQEEAQQKQYPNCIRWNLKVYSMQCKDCHNWGDPYLYESQLEAFAKSFCFIISHIVEDIEDKKPHKDRRNKIIEEMHKHQEQLCQACQKGQCYNVQKGAEGKKSQV